MIPRFGPIKQRDFGYAAAEVAVALGYRGHSGVHSALTWIETGSHTLKQTAEKLARKLH